MNIFNNGVLIIMIVIITQCGSSRTASDQINLKVSVEKIDSWLNFMPGGSPTFHIAGQIKIERKGSDTAEIIKLKQVSIFQERKKIYEFVPLFEIINDKESDSGFRFGTNKGLSINRDLDEEKMISAELQFESAGRSFLHKIENIKIEKAY